MWDESEIGEGNGISKPGPDLISPDGVQFYFILSCRVKKIKIIN